MSNWEYKILQVEHLNLGTERELNSFGGEGWEVVSVTVYYRSGYVILLKRSAPSTGRLPRPPTTGTPGTGVGLPWQPDVQYLPEGINIATAQLEKSDYVN